jgi:hypothetical protein
MGIPESKDVKKHESTIEGSCMRSKPAELSAGLVAIKGTAAPSPDMPGRAGGPVVTAVPPLAETAAPAATRPTARKAKAEPAEEKEANLAPLNFRIPASFRREFKTYAATHDLKLNELLRRCFEAYRRQQRD